MYLKSISVLISHLILAACMSTSNNAQNPKAPEATSIEVNVENMQHHNWELIKIDGKAFKLPEDFAAPNLEIGESFTANGHGGCNRYFGQAELKGNQFRIDRMASTMMGCPPEATHVEKIMTNVLGDWSTAILTSQTLELKNKSHTLTFMLRDWVN